MSSSDKRIHFGLGKESTIQSVEITWPGSQKQTLTNPRPDQLLSLTEP